MKTACLSNCCGFKYAWRERKKKEKKRTIQEHYVMMVCSIRYNWCVFIIAFLFRVYIFSVRSPRNWYVFVWFACFTISMMPLFIRTVENHFLYTNGSHKRENILYVLAISLSLPSFDLRLSLSLSRSPSFRYLSGYNPFGLCSLLLSSCPLSLSLRFACFAFP